MSEDAARMSVKTFADELGELIRRYLLTFDPSAPTKLQSISLAVTGANLGLNYTEQGGQPPSLHISLSPITYLMENPPEDDPRRKGGLFK